MVFIMSEKFENENEFNNNSEEVNDFDLTPSDFDVPPTVNDEDFRIAPETEPEQQNQNSFFTPPVSNDSYSTQQSNYNSFGSYSQNQNSSFNVNSNNANPYSASNNQYGVPNQQFTPYGYNQPPRKPKKSNKGLIAVVAILAVAVIIAVLSIAGSSIRRSISKSPSQETSLASGESNSTSDNNEASISYETTAAASTSQLSAVQVAEKVRPSVVGVMTYKSGQLSGEGSGVVMGLDSTGKYTYIITCAHVISDKGVTYGILTLDGKRYEASMVAYDVRTDIGVLKVETTDLTTAEFGDSTSLKIGETVYAVGNPGGSEYFGSITDGIISAIDRSVSSTYTMTCIQHNAAINPGNSGGALVNSAGQVIAINSSKIAATDFEGMGFAIPMSTVKPIVEGLIKYGYVPNRPKLGIQYASVDSYQLYSMVVAIKGLPKGSLIVAAISDDSSLAGTKAEVGDMIIAVNGKNMDDSSVLLDLIDKGTVGDSITLTLCRVESRTYKTTTFDVTITLVEDKGEPTTEATTSVGGYNYGGASSFEDFFNNYFGFDW